MKKVLLIITFLILLTGCGKEKTSLEKFQDYLEDTYQMKCEKNLCTHSTIIANVQKTYNEFNFDKKTYTHGVSGLYDITSKNIVYNWFDNKATGEIKEVSIEVSATYDFNTNEYVCDSKFHNKGYTEKKCDALKTELETFRSTFYTLLDDSKSNFLEG